MSRSQDRSSELEIFKLFYGSKSNITFEHKNKPDFWVTSNTNLKFGVEVTELFVDESDARLYKINNYVEDLLDFKKYRHKDDKMNLEISELTILDENGALKYKTNAIARKPNEGVKLYRMNLQERIKNKNPKLADYDKKFSFFNLLIRDHDTVSVNFKADEIFSIIFDDKTIEILKESGYDEIYLIRNIENTLTAFPLKGILILSRLSYLMKCCSK